MPERMLATRIRRTAVEFVIIVAGVLVALAVDEWREGHEQRADERAYVLRLARDIRFDSTFLVEGNRLRDEKIEVLNNLLDLAPSRSLTADQLRQAARGLALASRGAWGSLPPQRVTFDELLSTGSLALIRDQVLRQKIAEYYRDFDLVVARIGVRMTAFPKLTYGWVRRGPGELEFAAVELSESEIERLRDYLAVPDFKVILTAELNRSELQTYAYSSQLAEADSLLERLDAYR